MKAAIDVRGAVSGLVTSVQARGRRICSNEGASAYTVGYLQSMMVRMIEQLPQTQQRRLVEELNGAALFEVKS